MDDLIGRGISVRGGQAGIRSEPACRTSRQASSHPSDCFASVLGYGVPDFILTDTPPHSSQLRSADMPRNPTHGSSGSTRLSEPDLHCFRQEQRRNAIGQYSRRSRGSPETVYRTLGSGFSEDASICLRSPDTRGSALSELTLGGKLMAQGPCRTGTTFTGFSVDGHGR
jgi:hypothetical protein